MASPAEVTIFKGSKESRAVKGVVKPKTDLNAHDVAIRITHSGVCATDLHHIHEDIVLGHEGIGVVERIGDQVTKFQIGDRVGFGYVRDGCGSCEFCLKGDYFYCKVAPRQYGTQDFDQGSFSTYAVWPDTNLHRIPDNISSADAAPFMCAGLTVFTPMLKHDIGRGHRVGVLGIGGLGHLAIGFASKRGAEVVVFSGSESKRKEALELGASEFWVTKDLESKKPEKGVDFLIVTSTQHPNWSTFIDLVNPQGHIITLGLTTDDLVIPFLPFMLKEISIHGALTSRPDQIQQMLKFASENGVRPIIEEFPMTEEGVAQAIEKLVSGTIRYRGVLTAPTA